MPKFCKNCGKENVDESKFCFSCGASFENSYSDELRELNGVKGENNLKKIDNNVVADVNIFDNEYGQYNEQDKSEEYNVYLIEEKKSNGWLVTVIDLVIFFILLVTIGWIAAFIISTAVALILRFIFNSKNRYNKFFMSLIFDEDKLSFESKSPGKSDFAVPFNSIINVNDIKMDGLFNKQISLNTPKNSFIFELANYSLENFDELIAKLNSVKNIE
ncbi:zinc ribbon domain-containing protein [Methanobrevibacter curvatus]|uniref:Zinc-ribbon domain-containing protein n=1 Tax=Methanobrevibacter curvatus TaxID=49547 RepID=A0A162FEQ5_9EURY|nr:zinc ribbon domain-containing protein [Methanobrevibacter curvatus]KZX11965.1 hypothetical protein MBCUR_12300 [Methanobrevibacter curvatus]